ncbi:MAG: hypothetical protein ABI947_30305 [Chloroflexota bacterium]
MTRWTKLISIALVAVLAAAVFGATVVRADESTDNQTGARRVVLAVTKAVTDAVLKETKLDQATLRKEVGGKTLTDVITAHGATVAAVKADATATLTDEANKAVADKKLTQAQADKLLSRLDTALDRLLTRQYPTVQTRLERLVKATGYTLLLKETATETKLKARDLLKEMRDGKTLSQIATEHQADPAKIVSAAVDQATKRINQLVTNGKANADEAKTIIAGLPDSFTKLMNTPGPIRATTQKGGKKLGKGQPATPEAMATPAK